MNGLLHCFLKLLHFQMLGHINFEQINRIPSLPCREHRVNGSQNHSGNGDDSPFLSPTLGDALIFQRIVLDLKNED